MRRLSALALVLTACSGTPDSSTGPLMPPPAGQGVQYEMVSTLMPGMEIERCKLFQAPPEGLYINKEAVRFSAGSHHVLLYALKDTTMPTTKRDGKTAIDPNVVNDCADGAPADYNVVSVVAGAQLANGLPVVDLPSDTAVHIAGSTVMVMNTHYLNATPNMIDTDARINIYTIPQAQAKVEAGIIFFYDPIIRVPSMSPAQARMACPINRDYTVYNLQSHMHKRGVGYLANLTDTMGNLLMPLYTADSWENVVVKKYDPPLQVHAGQMFDYRCEYQNNEDHTILQGLTTKDEMCMLIGAYAPRNGAFEYCSPDGTSSNKGYAATFIGSGPATCMDSVGCLENARKVSKSMQSDAVYACILNSCEKASRPFNDAVRCEVTEIDGQCKTQCADFTTDACATCLHGACATEMSNCGTASCN